MRQFKIGVLGMLFLAFILSACSISVDSDDSLEHLMSREYVSDWCNTSNCGWSIDSPELMSLSYIYSLDELKEKYGESFVADDIEGNAEWGPRFFYYYQGQAVYVVTVEKEKWVVELSKEYNKKWEITDCYLEGSK